MAIMDHRNYRGTFGSFASSSPSNSFIGVHLDRVTLGTLVCPPALITIVDWAAGDYDFGGWFNPAAPTVVTVPPGVTRARVFFQFFFQAAFTINDALYFFSQLETIVPLTPAQPLLDNGLVSYIPGPGSVSAWSSMSGAFDVSPGDEISIACFPAFVGALSVPIGGNQFQAFAVEAVTVEP